MYAVSRFHLLQEDNPIKLKPRRSESSEPQGCKLRFLAMYSRMSTRRNKTAQMVFFSWLCLVQIYRSLLMPD